MIDNNDRPIQQPSHTPSSETAIDQGVSIDSIINGAVDLCKELPSSYDIYTERIEELRERLSKGKLHFAVLGQFNRGKSTFINALLGVKVLPTSVLPLTNVPTVIRYGRTEKSIVSFSDEKDDEIAENSSEAIQQLLIKYVTEENNPKNRHKVASVHVECSSDLVRNGTVIIDTPGFGSTFIHNTQTTIDLLSECDAAFFLLSADLPITEIEVSFLKEMQKFVPRIFFVFNKVDLLNEEERTKTTKFVRAEVRQHLDLPTDVTLFPINARQGESSTARDETDQPWNRSGLQAIVDAINHFMIADKYFILSHALNEKLHDALDGITSTLGKEIAEIGAPVSELHEAVLQLKEKVEDIEKQSQSEITMVEAEKKALTEFLDKTIDKQKQSLHGQTEEFFHDILKQDNVKLMLKDRLTTSYPSFYTQASKAFVLQVTTAINKPLRKASLIHRREFERIAQKARQLLNVTFTIPDAVKDTLEGMEISPPYESISKNTDETLARLSTSFSDRFKSKEALGKHYETIYLPILKEHIDSSIEILSKAFHEKITHLCSQLSAELTNSYSALKKSTSGKQEEQESRWHQAQEKARPQIEKKEDLKEGFEKIKKRLP
ncbi:MAG: hypothetical protein GF401_18395 [Chitinivibrionales bacterium]|nr:hypothetical protein [Chitinivibrionales bacterium]